MDVKLNLIKRPLNYFNVISGGCLAIAFMGLLAPLMHYFIAIILSVSLATFVEYIFEETVYWWEKHKYNKWAEENKEQLEAFEEHLEKALRRLRDEQDGNTEAGNRSEEEGTKGTKEEE